MKNSFTSLALVASLLLGSLPVFAQEAPSQPQTNPTYTLSPADQELIAEGRISTGAIVGGATVSFLIGLGLGQAIEGRFAKTGWIVLLGELVGLGMYIGGIAMALNSIGYSSSSNTLTTSGGGSAVATTGLILYSGFHLGGFVESIVAPILHNSRIDVLEAKAGRPLTWIPRLGILPIVSAQDRGAFASLQWRF